MSIPVPDLDDRRFQDLVDEAKRMIPSLVPEWTNHNVADPGVALIELFAWMSEQVVYRLNQVPEKLHVEFLNLVGTTPFPASAARTDLTFRISPGTGQVVTVPAGTEVGSTTGSVVFSTLDELRIQQPELVAALTSHDEATFVDVWDTLSYDGDSLPVFSSDPVEPDDALLLGFRSSLAGQLLELHLQATARGVGVDPSDPPIVWEVWSGEHWIATDVVEDETGGLNRDGTIRLVVPPAHEALVLNGERLHWLRVRLLEVPPGRPTYQSSPRITTVRATVGGGSIVAEHARTVVDESFGTSDGTPAQQFRMANRPVLPRRDGEHVVVRDEGTTTVWTEVADFGASRPTDHHVVVDEALGVVRFGPRIRHPDGATTQHGAIPPHGATVGISRYRTGGGASGNVGAGTLRQLRTTIPYVSSVRNRFAAIGGVDPETVDEVRLRGPRTLRTGRRAVTASDYEQLALQSSPRVARARCLPPVTSGDAVRLLVVPATDVDPTALRLDDFAMDDDLYEEVSTHLDERRTLGARLRIATPFFHGVSVIVRVRAVTGRSPAAVKDRVERRLAEHLSPLTGGPQGTGWGFGQTLTTSDLVALVDDVPGVGEVAELTMFEFDLRNERRVGDRVDTLVLDEDSLLLSRRPQVVVR